MTTSIEISEEGGVRYLHFGSRWIQGAMRIARPYALELEYTRDMMVPLLLRRGAGWPRSVLQIGLGAASLTRFLHRYRPRAAQTIVEIEPRVIAAAVQSFKLPPEDARIFMSEFNIEEPSLNRMIRLSYDLLKLQSFFTVGEDEVRAWTVRRGANAHQAAGEIHTDLQKGFIRAEVVTYADLVSLGGLAEARAKGKLRLEGKEYILQDGEIMHVRFNI